MLNKHCKTNTIRVLSLRLHISNALFYSVITTPIHSRITTTTQKKSNKQTNFCFNTTSPECLKINKLNKVKSVQNLTKNVSFLHFFNCFLHFFDSFPQIFDNFCCFCHKINLDENIELILPCSNDILHVNGIFALLLQHLVFTTNQINENQLPPV